MFRRTRAILDDTSSTTPDPLEVAKVDADLIMTCAVMGFCASRLAVGQPVEFSTDPREPEALPRLAQATELIKAALGKRYLFGGSIGAVTAPEFAKAAVITGSAGGARTPFAQRHAEVNSVAAATLRELAADPPKYHGEVGYQGKGAYTGFISDPIADRGSVSPRFGAPCPPRLPVSGGCR